MMELEIDVSQSISSADNSTIKQEFSEELGNENGDISIESDVLQDLKFEIDYESDPSKTDHKDEIFVCNLCGEFLHSQKALGDHELQCKIECKSVPLKRDPQEEIVCELGGKFLSSKRKLGHKLEYHENNTKDFQIKDEMFLCEVCQEIFRSEEDLEDHKLSHLEAESEGDADEAENAYVCSVCNEVFDNKKDLVEHKNSILECYEHRKCDKCEDGSAQEFSCIWELIDHVKDKHGLNVGDTLCIPWGIGRSFSLVGNSTSEASGSPCPVSKSAILDIVEKKGDIVQFLLVNNFSAFSEDLKCLVKSITIYSWLTGSETENALFCWCCSLFIQGHQTYTWRRLGCTNLENLSRSLMSHSISKEHIYSELKFKMFDKTVVSDAQYLSSPESIDMNDENVAQNRDVYNRFIDAVILCASQEPAPNQINCEEMLKVMAKYDTKLKDFFETQKEAFSEEIQNDLLSSVCHVVRRHIEEEVSNAVCFSWQVDKTTTIPTRSSQLSIIFRYCLKGVPVARFIEFLDVGFSTKAEKVSQLLTQRYEKFNLWYKLVGQTYDGATVGPEELKGLQTRVEVVAPMAVFTHCYAHNLNSVLWDACTPIRDCANFFEDLRGFSDFLSKCPEHARIFDNLCCPDSQTNPDFEYRIVFSVKNKREDLLCAIHFIDDQDVQTKYATKDLEDRLNDFNFLFHLNTFESIFLITEFEYSVIQNKNTNIVLSNTRIHHILSTLKSYRSREKYFRSIYDEAKQQLGLLGPPQKKNKNEQDFAHFRRVFNEILDTCITQIEVRFNDLKSLTFFDLLNRDKFAQYKKSFPKFVFEALLKVYPHVFDRNKLENELSIVYKDDDFYGDSISNLAEMSKFLFINSIDDTLSEISKLFSIILSLPPSSTERGFSTFERMKTFARNSTSKMRLSDFALASIEKPLIQQLQNDASFYDKIIDHFAETKIRKIDLIYTSV
ncbi:unnamed protein product [Phaedon cochleariae]|uniref:C2H2-type domain-containing protein n=1 Tax=Phaedon cochleariae TaxID=80249 RepID=A0A9N9SII8_PHACE|nr:unnamed protein product [Phaedon cochleariae]